MRRRLDRVAQADPRLVDAVLAVAVIAALELTGWLSAGVSTQDRAVTTAAAVLCAAPIAVRRRWPAGALVFSMCRRSRLDAVRRAAVVERQRLRPSAAVAQLLRRCGAGRTSEHGRVGGRARARVGVGAAPRSGRIDNRGGSERRRHVLRRDAAGPDLANRPLRSPAPPADKLLPRARGTRRSRRGFPQRGGDRC